MTGAIKPNLKCAIWYGLTIETSLNLGYLYRRQRNDRANLRFYVKAPLKKGTPFMGRGIPPLWSTEEMKNRTGYKNHGGNL
jgi:hypothetical protein